MTCLDRRLYNDPETVLMNKQEHERRRREGAERVCMGCAHKRILFVGKEKVKACAIKRGNPTIYCNFHKKEKDE